MSKQNFTFNIRLNVDVQADNIVDAFEQLTKKIPNIKQNDVMHAYMNDNELGCAFSRETGECIYYNSGCLAGYTDCVFDPMEDIAKDCEHQSDMTPDKYKSCKYYDFEQDRCHNYDDECE